MSKGYEEKDLPPPYTPTPTHDYTPPDYDPVYPPPPQNQQRDPRQPMPYSAENDASSSSSGSIIGQFGQAAFDAVSSIINSRLEHRQQKLDKRQQKREQKQMRRDSRRKGKGRETQCNYGSNNGGRTMQTRSMEYQRGSWFNNDGLDEKNKQSSCGYNNNNTRETNQPPHSMNGDSDSSDSESLGNTAETLDIKRKNMPFEFKEDWFGKECNISTTNGNLVIRGNLEAKDTISLKCSNGTLTIDGDLVSRNSIIAEGSNGPVLPRGQSIMSKNISIKTSNAPLHFNTMIQGEYVKLKTSNAPIILTNLTVFSELNVKTTCAPVEIHIDDLGPKAEVNIETSMSPIKVYMPRNFAGEFTVKTTLASTEVVSKSEGTDVTITKDEGTCIKGVCTKYGQKGKARVTIKSSMAHATLYL